MNFPWGMVATITPNGPKKYASYKMGACKFGHVLRLLYMGSGNEHGIFYVMLDKSTYLKKLA